MIKHKFIHHYATTFLRIAQEKDAVLKYQEQLQDFAQLLKENAFLKEVLLDPIEMLEHKKAMLKQVLVEEEYDIMVCNFLFVILDQHHEKHLLRIIQDFQAMVNNSLNKVQGTVQTAVSLTAKRQADLENAFSQKLNRQVSLTQLINPSLIGGLSVEIAGQVYEKSLLQSMADGLVYLSEDPSQEMWLKKYANNFYSQKSKQGRKKEPEIQLKATVFSVIKLNKIQRQALESSLYKYFGKPVILEFRLDPSLLGGVLVRVGDIVLDGSMYHRLTKLQVQLLKGIS